MLSFGHAAYFGVGAFGTVHAMNASGGAGLLPTPLLPLAGASRRPGHRRDRRLVRDPAQRHLLRDDHPGHRRAGPLPRAASEGTVRRRGRRLDDADAGLGHGLRVDHAGLLPHAGMGPAVGRVALPVHAHAARAGHLRPAREQPPAPLPRLQRPRSGHAGLRHLGHVLRHRRRPAGAVQRISQLRGVRCEPVGRGGAQHLHRRRPRVPRAGPGRSADDLLRLRRVGPHALLAALPGHPVRARDVVHAFGHRRPVGHRLAPARALRARPVDARCC